jgi:hypothetical protein
MNILLTTNVENAPHMLVYMMLLTVLFGLLIVAALSVLAGAGVLLCVGRPS